jgi:hypothetical protein
MGFSKSVSASNSEEQVQVHKELDPSIIPSVGSSTTHSSPTHLIVRENLFRWSGDINITTTEGAPFRNGLKVLGNVVRDQMVLVDATTCSGAPPIAVCMRKAKLFGQCFKIYSTRPFYPSQRPSKSHKYNHRHALYTHAKVEQQLAAAPSSRRRRGQLQVTFASETSPSYTVQHLGPNKRVIMRQEQQQQQLAASIQGGFYRGKWNSHLITIVPGNDPCLMLCLVAICDEMDKFGVN